MFQIKSPKRGKQIAADENAPSRKLDFPVWRNDICAIRYALPWYWRGDFLGEVPNEAVDEHIEFGEALPTLQSAMHPCPVDSFSSRVDRHEIAFANIWEDIGGIQTRAEGKICVRQKSNLRGC